MNRSSGNDDDNCADAKNILLFDSKYNESSSNNSTRKKMWGNKKKMLVDDNGNDNARSDLKFCNLKKTHTHIDVMHFLWMWHSNIKSWKQTLVLPQSIVHSISFPGFVCVFGAFGNKIHAINKLQVSFSPLMHTLQINIKWIRRTNERTLSLAKIRLILKLHAPNQVNQDRVRFSLKKKTTNKQSQNKTKQYRNENNDDAHPFKPEKFSSNSGKSD